MKAKISGFTLTEVLIAMAIVTVLVAVAVPSYKENVAKSRRAEAKTAVMALAQAAERWFTARNTYTGASTSGASAIFSGQVPTSGTTVWYALDIAPNAAGNDYTITATRKGTQADDPCGDFTLTASGRRGLVSASKTVQQCWGS